LEKSADTRIRSFMRIGVGTIIYLMSKKSKTAETVYVCCERDIAPGNPPDIFKNLTHN